MAKQNRSKVGDFEIGDIVKMKAMPNLGSYRIKGFPSRRTAIIESVSRCINPSIAKVTLHEISKVVE